MGDFVSFQAQQLFPNRYGIHMSSIPHHTYVQCIHILFIILYTIYIIHYHCPCLMCSFPTPNIMSLLPCSGGSGQPMVGKYSVCLASFEEVALPALRIGLSTTEHVRGDQVPQHGEQASLQQTPILLVVDEIGKMELFSQKFEEEVRRLFDQPDVVVLATVPLQSKHRSLSLVDQLMSRNDVSLHEVSCDVPSSCIAL